MTEKVIFLIQEALYQRLAYEKGLSVSPCGLLAILVRGIFRFMDFL